MFTTRNFQLKFLMTSIFISLLFLFSVNPVYGQDKLYWLQGNTTQDIVRYNLSTGMTEQTRSGILTAGNPAGIVFNSSGTTIHWYNEDFASGSHFYSLTNAFGAATSATQESTSANILSTPRYLAYDAVNDRIFAVQVSFSGGATSFIRSYDPDGTNASANLQSAFSAAFLTSYTGIALDVPNGEMYFADVINGTIVKASMTTAGGTQTTIINGLGSNVKDIELDLTNRKVYWIDGGTGFNSTYSINSADIDGTLSANNTSA